MTRPQQRVGIPAIVKDHHRRIRRLEASPSGGGGSDCPDCVLDPFTVNPGDITVPEALRGCVDIAGLGAGGPSEFLSTCGSSPITSLFTGAPLGFCSYIGLGKPLGLQIRVNTALGGNISNIIVYAGTVESQVYATGWNPGESPATFDSGWVDIDAGSLCGFASCAPITLGATFAPHNTFFGSCVGPGIVAARYVVLDDDGEFRGALDDLPQAEDGDVIHFSSDTHEFVTGPARRRTSYFMG